MNKTSPLIYGSSFVLMEYLIMFTLLCPKSLYLSTLISEDSYSYIRIRNFVFSFDKMAK